MVLGTWFMIINCMCQRYSYKTSFP